MGSFIQSVRLSFLIACRHWQIFRRNIVANLSPSLVDPFLYVMVFGYWLGSTLPIDGERSYLAFMAPGIVPMAALFSGYFEGSYGFFVRLEFEFVFKALLTTPVGPYEIFFGEVLWLGLKGAILSSIVCLVLCALSVVDGTYALLVPIIGALVGISCGTIGLIASCYVKSINQFQSVYAWLISPMFFTSGMFVPVHLMPKGVQYVCWISPYYHGVQLAQATLWHQAVGNAWTVHGSALLVLSAVLLAWAGRLIMPRLHL